MSKRALLAAATLLALSPSPVAAEPVALGGLALEVVEDTDNFQRVLTAGGTELARDFYVDIYGTILGPSGEPEAAVVAVGGGGNACAPALRVVIAAEGEARISDPVGPECTSYQVFFDDYFALFLARPTPAEDGEVILYSVDGGFDWQGVLAFQAFPGTGFASLAGFDGHPLDLLRNADVLGAVEALWGAERRTFARYLGTASNVTTRSGYLVGAGCLPHSCGYTIGLILVDVPGRKVFTAYFNEGAPDVRPALSQWPLTARALYEQWRHGRL